MFGYTRITRKAKAVERGIKMVPVLIHLPPPSEDTNSAGRDLREVTREKVSQAEVLYNLIAGTATAGFKSKFYGQRHLSFEIIATQGTIHFYAAVPVALLSVVQKAIVTAYPGAQLEEVEDHNLFNPLGRISGTFGGELTLKQEAAYPIATYHQLERDPMQAIINTLSALSQGDGAGVQIMFRPAPGGWAKGAHRVAERRRKGHKGLKFTPLDLIKAAWKVPDKPAEVAGAASISEADQAVVAAIEEKAQHPVFEVLVRLMAASNTASRSQQLLRDLVAAFALFDAPGLNGFKLVEATNIEGLVTAFIFRFFPPELGHDVLNSVELATLFHLPDAQFTASAQVERQASKQVDGPVDVPATGPLFGYNIFRGARKEIRLSQEDRRRHTYIIGQTGTGKSSLLENLAVQDMTAGRGFAFIDPHGDTAERLLGVIPKSRAEDVIYFNPADVQQPLGLNLFEFQTPEQKDFLIQESIQMLYKLYDPGHTGIIGPRYEHWFRNAALTLMSDPAGATFIEIPKVFTDVQFLKQKFKFLRDQTVIDFWTKEMAQTSDYHKSEMLGWFVSKFGAFQQNEIMRNIIGQPKSAFNLRQVMDQGKILIVNLSKGQIGELNSQLLGMIFVIKFQAAAMSRASEQEEQRPDFCLYVDEFQNFSTDSFASILSESRKYRLNLVVANQFMGQLSAEIKEAVFGNVGSILSFRVGPEDADFLVKQFAPLFDAHDLVNLPNGQAIMRLMIGGVPSQPFSLKTLPRQDVINTELALAIKQLSAAKFGRTKTQVESEISQRLNPQPPSPPNVVAAPPAPSSAPPPAAPASVSRPPANAALLPASAAPRPASAWTDRLDPPRADPPPQAASQSVTVSPQASMPPWSSTLTPTLPTSAPAPASTRSPNTTLTLQDIVKTVPASSGTNPPLPPSWSGNSMPSGAPAAQAVAEEIKAEGLENVIKMTPAPAVPAPTQTPPAPPRPPQPPPVTQPSPKPPDPIETTLIAGGSTHLPPATAPRAVIAQPPTPATPSSESSAGSRLAPAQSAPLPARPPVASTPSPAQSKPLAAPTAEANKNETAAVVPVIKPVIPATRPPASVAAPLPSRPNPIQLPPDEVLVDEKGNVTQGGLE